MIEHGHEFNNLMLTWERYLLLQEIENSKGKIKSLLEKNDFILFLQDKTNKEIYATDETGRLIFAKLKSKSDPDENPDEWKKDASFICSNLSKSMSGDKEETVFGIKDLPKLKIISDENELINLLIRQLDNGETEEVKPVKNKEKVIDDVQEGWFGDQWNKWFGSKPTNTTNTNTNPPPQTQKPVADYYNNPAKYDTDTKRIYDKNKPSTPYAKENYWLSKMGTTKYNLIKQLRNIEDNFINNSGNINDRSIKIIKLIFKNLYDLVYKFSINKFTPGSTPSKNRVGLLRRNSDGMGAWVNESELPSLFDRIRNGIVSHMEQVLVYNNPDNDIKNLFYKIKEKLIERVKLLKLKGQ